MSLRAPLTKSTLAVTFALSCGTTPSAVVPPVPVAPRAPFSSAPPSALEDPCVPSTPGSQGACQPQPTRLPRWRTSCALWLPESDELEIELTRTGSMVCLEGRLLARGASAAHWVSGMDEVCLRSDGHDRWPHFEAGTIVYFVPSHTDGDILAGGIACIVNKPTPAPAEE